MLLKTGVLVNRTNPVHEHTTGMMKDIGESAASLAYIVRSWTWNMKTDVRTKKIRSPWEQLGRQVWLT